MPKVNKVEYFGETLIDLSNDTVQPENLDEGVTAHSADGEAITGIRAVMKPNDYVKKSGDTMTGKLIAQNNVDYADKQVRNIMQIEQGAALPSEADNGDVCIIYQLI